MQKLKLVILLAFAGVVNSFAQCPIAGFNVNDTVCAGIPFSLTNTSAGASSYQWDFCPNDLSSTPTGINIPNPGGLLAAPQQIKLVKDDGNYYLFVANYVNANILRIDFGTNLANTTPNTFSYTGFVNPIGVDVVKDGNTWYGLVTDNGNNHLYRINLGDTIGNNIYSNTDLGLVNFNQPKFIKIMKDDVNFYAFVANIGDNNINKIKFGSSLGNVISDSSIFTDVSFSAPWGIDFTYDCVSNKYVGFIANNNTSKISVVDFGSSLANTGSVAHTFPLLELPAGINILKEGDAWHLMVAGPSDGTLQQLNFGSDILNPNPTSIFNANIGSLNGPRGISFIRDSSRWYGLIGNAGDNTLSSIKYENNCAVNVPYSEDSLPLNVFYTDGGWHNINLTVENNGFVSSHTDSVYVEFAPQVNFAHSAACSGQPVSFYDSTIIIQGSISSWQWDFGDGTAGSPSQNPVHSYAIDSSYLVTLTVTGSSGCVGTFSDSITIHGIPVADFNFTDNQCSGTSIPFTDNSNAASGDFIATWEWDFGDGTTLVSAQNPIHVFDTAGTYTVQLIIFGSSGCSDTSLQTIHILPAPVANFSVSQTCLGETTLFTNNTQGSGTINYNWDFGDGATDNITSPSHAYAAVSMNYIVTLVALSTNGCSDTILQNVHISTRANPGFIFLPDTACAGNNIQFIDTSTIAAGDTIGISTWDFGDASALTIGDTVNHIYASSGTYNVILTVTSLTSCDTSITKTISVIDGPSANFLFNNVCLSNQSIFIDSSTTPIGTTIDSILWDFGDGAIAGGPSATHVYSNYGLFTVTETVFNNNGCSGTVSKVVTVYDQPVASFTYNAFICTGTNVCFANLSTVNDDSIIAYVWNFGDGQSSTLENPCHIYNVGGTYPVNLIVTSSHGCTGNTLQSALVNTSPLFNFSDSLSCFGDSTHFVYHSLIIPDLANTWNWNFGDGDILFVPNPVHYYDSAGVYNVTLTVTAINSCSVTDTQTVTISPKPSVGILADSAVCFGNDISFNDNSTIASGSILQWTWNFGDATPLVFTPSASHNYGTAASYTVTHIVVSDMGCADSVKQTVLVEPLPSASFIPDHTFGSPPLPVQFLNTSNGAASYQWNFGDNNMSTATSPTHTYSDTGLYNVCLIALDIFGCADTACESISALVPYLELGIRSIHATTLNDLLSISANLVNLGNVAINKFQISAETENGSPVNEQWQSVTPLRAGDTLTYNFAARYEIDPLNIPSYFCVEISEMNDTSDAVESNNRKCSAINDQFQVFGIFPNPSNNNVQIGMNVPAEGTIDINFYDAAGRLIKRYAGLAVVKGYNAFNYSIRSFAKGFYACTVQFRDDVLVKKIIKK